MKMRFAFLLVALVLIVSSCAPTKYTHADSSADYGYTEIPLDDNTYRVSFHGNARTDKETVDRYALYRSAELTLSKGFDYFIVTENSSGSTVSGGTSYNSNTNIFSGGTSTEHETSKNIKIFKGTKPADNVNAYDAHAIIKNMDPYIVRE